MSQHVFVVTPAQGHSLTHTVILLHGRDSNGGEFAAELFESETSQPAAAPRTLRDHFPTVRWVFPTAPLLQSKRFDTSMHQWFDIWSVEDPEEQPWLQKEGLEGSISAVLDIIKCEQALVSRENIFLGGISQGFATALATFFADGRGFGGLIVSGSGKFSTPS
jgi:lysophospholipase II